MTKDLTDDYGLSKEAHEAPPLRAPQLPYRPRDPIMYRPAIGLIGCGGISAQHLNAYKTAGYRVTALCDRHAEKARSRQQQFFPDAKIYTDYHQLLAQNEIEVVDITAHPADRFPIMLDAVKARKHVLSQKPFVLDIDDGERLINEAVAHGVRLAVNQNARWAPHFSYIHQAIKSNFIGDLRSAHFCLHWDHSWIEGTPFENIADLILYDFAIHWFDLITYFFGERIPERVCASVRPARGQTVRPPMLAQVLIDFADAQASMVFNGDVKYGQEDHTVISGTIGTIKSTGPSLSDQAVTLYTAAGVASPALEGTWFREGFHGAMGELLCAIEEKREPGNSARGNLRSLALSFAAIASAGNGGRSVGPGEVRKMLPTSA